MRAVVQTRYGSPDDLELREVPLPSPGEGEVLVRVRATSLHPDVWHVVTGTPWVVRVMGAGLRRPKNPIPGTDMAGVVEAAGEGAHRFRLGDAVFGETLSGHQWTHGGAFAEYVTVREAWLAPKPEAVGFEEAASVPTSGFIALINFRDWRTLPAGTRVLVNGAAGGVGSIALQVAKARGAHVTAVDGSAKLDLLRELGADEVIDYTREDFTRRGVRYDRIFDVPGSRPFSEIRRALEPDGRYVPIGHEHFGTGRRVLGLIPHFVRLMMRSLLTGQPRRWGMPQPSRGEAMAALSEMLHSGDLRPVVDSTWPLERVHAAFRRMVEGDTLGRVVLTIGEPG